MSTENRIIDPKFSCTIDDLQKTDIWSEYTRIFDKYDTAIVGSEEEAELEKILSDMLGNIAEMVVQQEKYYLKQQSK